MSGRCLLTFKHYLWTFKESLIRKDVKIKIIFFISMFKFSNIKRSVGIILACCEEKNVYRERE